MCAGIRVRQWRLCRLRGSLALEGECEGFSAALWKFESSGSNEIEEFSTHARIIMDHERTFMVVQGKSYIMREKTWITLEKSCCSENIHAPCKENLGQEQRSHGIYEDLYGYGRKFMTHARMIMSMQGNSWSWKREGNMMQPRFYIFHKTHKYRLLLQITQPRPLEFGY